MSALHCRNIGAAAGAESFDGLDEVIGLLSEVSNGCGRFLDHRGILLGDAIHIAYGQVDLAKRDGLPR